MGQQFFRDEGQWFDENLSPIDFDAGFLTGKIVMVTDQESETEVFVVRPEYMEMIENAPNGSTLEIADSLDTHQSYGVA